MSNRTFLVSGMSCGHCVSAVRAEISKLAGVTSVDIDLDAARPTRVTVSSSDELSDDALRAAVDEAGYHVVEIQR
jgi:copper chaperone CopZ